MPDENKLEEQKKEIERRIPWVVRLFFDQEKFEKDLTTAADGFSQRLKEIFDVSRMDLSKGIGGITKQMLGDLKTLGLDSFKQLKDVVTGSFSMPRALGGGGAAGGGAEGGAGGGAEGGAAGGEGARKEQTPEMKAWEDARKQLLADAKALGDQVRGALSDGWAALRQEAPTVWATVTGEISRLGTQLGDWFDTTSVGKKVTEARAWFAQLKADVRDLAGQAKDNLSRLGDDISTRLNNAWSTVKSGARSAAQSIGGAVDDAAEGIGGVFERAMGRLKGSRVGQAVGGAFDSVAEMAGKAGNAVAARWNAALDKVQGSRLYQSLSASFNRVEGQAETSLDKVRGAISRRMDGIGAAFGKLKTAGGNAFGALTSLVSGPMGALGMQAAQVALQKVGQALKAAFRDADRLSGSVGKLQDAAKKSNVPLEQLQAVSKNASERFQLSSRAANELTASVAEMAAGAGKAGETEEMLGAVLDIGARRNLSSEEALKALQGALGGSTEEVQKLFGEQPAEKMEEFARTTDEARRSALLMEMAQSQAAQAQGAYAERMATSAGANEIFQHKTEEAAARLGRALEPARELWHKAVDWLKEKLFTFLSWALEGITGFITGAQVLATRFQEALSTIPDRLRLMVANSLDRLGDLVARFGIVLKIFGVDGDEVAGRLRARAAEMRQEAEASIAAAQQRQFEAERQIRNPPAQAAVEQAATRPPPSSGAGAGTGVGTGAGRSGAPAGEPRESAAERERREAEERQRARQEAAEAERRAAEERERARDDEIAQLAQGHQLNLLGEDDRRRVQQIEVDIRAELNRENLALAERIRLQERLNRVTELRPPAADPDEEREQRLGRLSEGAQAGVLNPAEQRELADIEGRLTEALEDQNLTLERRIRLTRQLQTAQGARGKKDALELAPLTAQNVFDTIARGARRAGDAIGQSFGQAFEMLGRDLGNTGAAFDALWAGIKKGAAEAVAEEARVNARKEIAAGISATGLGLTRLAQMNFPAAASAFAGAAQHFLAGAAWSVLAGAATSAGGGGAAASGGGGSGAPRESRDAGSGVAESAARTGPQIHIYVDGIDPRNPRHQKLTQETLDGVRERYGSESTVTYARR